MRKILILIQIILFSLILINCKNKDAKDIEITVLHPVEIKTGLRDDIFFTWVHFTADRHYLYIVDRLQSLLIQTDKDLNYTKHIELDGPSYMELISPSSINIFKDSILIEDLGGQKINIYTKEFEFVDSYRLPQPTIGFGLSFISHNEIVYSSFPSDFHSGINSLSLTKPPNSVSFGDHYPQKNNIYNQQQKYGLILEDSSLISVGRTLGYVDKMSHNGELINRFNLNKIEPIGRALDSMKIDFEQKLEFQNPNLVQDLILTAQSFGNNLLLGFTDRIGLDRTHTRHLVLLELNDEEINLKKIIRLETGTEDSNVHFKSVYYDSFSGRIYAQGLVTDYVYIFEINLN